MGKLRQHQYAPHRLDGCVTMNSFANGIANPFLQIMQEGVDGIVVELLIGHWPEGIAQWP